MNKQVIIKEYKGCILVHHTIFRKFCGEEIGRKDINGKSIKEGDIVLVDGRIDWGGSIIYNNRGCGFCFEHEDLGEYSFAHGWGEAQESYPEDSWEIVGSIYGN